MTPRCANGHPTGPDDDFCGKCGAPSEADLPTTEPEWAATAPTEAELMPACPQGHLNPPENAYCGTCGAEAVRTTPSRTPAADSHPLRGVAFAAVAAIVVVGAILLISRTEDEATTSPANVDDTAAPIPIENLCQVELLAWLDYSTQPGNSIMDVAAEFGIESPEWVIVNEAWSQFQGNRFQVGRSVATQLAIDQIEIGCTNLGGRFVPGFLPPQ